jgi:hypothetical protein
MYVGFWFESRKERDHKEKPRYRWENIKIDLRKNRIGWCGLESSGSG